MNSDTVQLPCTRALAEKLGEGRRSFADFLQHTLGRDYVFAPGQDLPAEERQEWMAWLESTAIPHNGEVEALMDASEVELNSAGIAVPVEYAEFRSYHRKLSDVFVSAKAGAHDGPVHAGQNFPGSLGFKVWQIVHSAM